jgi:glutamate synthase (NADPH/NADH) small chain
VICENGTFTADLVLKAIGQLFTGAGGEFAAGRIAVDAVYSTQIPGVFAGGDCTPGIDLTVHAVQDGKLAARAIDAFLKA